MILNPIPSCGTILLEEKETEEDQGCGDEVSFQYAKGPSKRDLQ